jgi:phosphoglycolate phosphatase
VSGAANRLAVFDCDGTLVDSQGIIVAAMTAAFEAGGLAAPDAHGIRHVVGLPLIESIRRLKPASGDPERLADLYREAYGTRVALPEFQEPLFIGAEAALDALDGAGYLLGIATGKGRRGLVRLFERHGLTGRFVTLQTADDAPGKPSPDMLLRAMAEAAAERSQTVMIGDTVYDMQMARNAGVASIGVAWGYHEAADLIAAGADVVAEDFAALPALIEDMTRGRRCA